LTDERRSLAKKNCPSVDANQCFYKFLAHHRAKGTLSKDWDSEWEFWTLSEREQPVVNGSSGRVESDADKKRRQLLKMVPLLNMEKKPGESESDFLHRIDTANNRRLEARDK
jgi:hypothetical protein